LDVNWLINEITAYGVIIYLDNKIYANKKAIELLELKKRSILNNLNRIDEIRKFFVSNKKIFKKVIVLNEKYITKYLNTYIKKLNENDFVLIVEDFTKFCKQNQIVDIIFHLNEVLLDATSQETLFKKFLNIVISKAKFSAAFVIIKEGNLLKPIYYHSKDKDISFLKNLIIDINDKKFEKLAIVRAFKEKKIIFNDDIRFNKNNPLKDEMLKRNYLSAVAIPVFKKGEVEAVICITKNEIEFFKGYKKLFEYISKFLSKKLEKLGEETFKNVLLNAINKGHEWVLITDKDGKILFVNEAVCEITGYTKDELLGKKPNIFKSGLHDSVFYKEMWDTITKGKIYENVVINKKKNGELFYLLDKIVPINGYYISLGKDITNEKKYFHLIEELKFKDPITGLYNKEGFFKYANEYLKKFKYEPHMLLIVDIRNFNALNHKYGIFFGDEVLKEVSKRLKQVFFDRDLIVKLKGNITLCRFNGDEFIIFLEKMDETHLHKILNKLYDVFSKEFNINDIQIKLDYNAGISVYPKDGKQLEMLLNNANAALLKAKKEGPNVVRLYSKEFSEEINKYIEVLNLIKIALEKDLFTLFYQPIVCTKDSKIIGAESLIRIKKDDVVLTPGHFISVLENTNYSYDVTLKMLEEIKDMLSKTKEIKISYNLCERQFRNENTLKKLFEIGNLYPNRFQIEVVERVLLHEKEYAIKILNELKDNGVLIAIDDFGTGYSSLSYIREFPVDIIKIDISFIRNMMIDPKDMIIVKTIINLAKELEIQTVAEGVEDEAQVAILKALGCDYIQGYYFYKPMPKEEFLKVLKLV